jgi:hypothetical protein
MDSMVKTYNRVLTIITMYRKRRNLVICKAFRESSRVRKAVSREAVVLREGTGSFGRNSREAAEPVGPCAPQGCTFFINCQSLS